MEFLNSLKDFSLIPNLDQTTAQFDLQRMVDLLALMGNPQAAFPIIHVAGTKGKGSTAAMIASVLRAAGYKVGLFTSPHLFDFCEQVQINGEAIPHDELARQVDALKPLLEQVKNITAFEAVTAICFRYFHEQKVDIAVVEAGLGGRTDATNVVDPLLSVITSISYDHTAMLGTTIQEIAGQKAGIIKPGRPVVVAAQVYLNASLTIMEEARKKGSEMILVRKVISCNEVSHALDGQVFSIHFNHGSTDWDGEYELPLLGKHQIENAATALTVLRQITTLGFPITPEQVKQGLQEVRWPCRFEVVSKDPLIVLDGAHNVDSAEKLKQAITDYLEGCKIILVFGALVDKDIAGIFEVLLPGIEKVIFSKSAHPRAAEPAMLVKLVQSGSVPYETYETISKALKRAKELADPKTAIVVTGSLFIAAAARQLIINPSRQEIE